MMKIRTVYRIHIVKKNSNTITERMENYFATRHAFIIFNFTLL